MNFNQGNPAAFDSKQMPVWFSSNSDIAPAEHDFTVTNFHL